MEGKLTEQFNPVQGSPNLVIDAPGQQSCGWELWLGSGHSPFPGPPLCGHAKDVPTVMGTCPQEWEHPGWWNQVGSACPGELAQFSLGSLG